MAATGAGVAEEELAVPAAVAVAKTQCEKYPRMAMEQERSSSSSSGPSCFSPLGWWGKLLPGSWFPSTPPLPRPQDGSGLRGDAAGPSATSSSPLAPLGSGALEEAVRERAASSAVSRSEGDSSPGLNTASDALVAKEGDLEAGQERRAHRICRAGSKEGPGVRESLQREWRDDDDESFVLAAAQPAQQHSKARGAGNSQLLSDGEEAAAAASRRATAFVSPALRGPQPRPGMVLWVDEGRGAAVSPAAKVVEEVAGVADAPGRAAASPLSSKADGAPQEDSGAPPPPDSAPAAVSAGGLELPVGADMGAQQLPPCVVWEFAAVVELCGGAEKPPGRPKRRLAPGQRVVTHVHAVRHMAHVLWVQEMPAPAPPLQSSPPHCTCPGSAAPPCATYKVGLLLNREDVVLAGMPCVLVSYEAPEILAAGHVRSAGPERRPAPTAAGWTTCEAAAVAGKVPAVRATAAAWLSESEP